jgi:hypothetical protein
MASFFRKKAVKEKFDSQVFWMKVKFWTMVLILVNIKVIYDLMVVIWHNVSFYDLYRTNALWVIGPALFLCVYHLIVVQWHIPSTLRKREKMFTCGKPSGEIREEYQTSAGN